MDEARLEAALRRLGRRLEWPDTVDLAPDVARRLAVGTVSRRRWVPVVASIAVMIAAILVISPHARRAVADLLGVGGIRIQVESEIDGTVGGALDLGRQVTLEEAARLVGFTPSVPKSLGEPAAVYASTIPGGGMVTIVWRGETSLPAAADSVVGLLYSQFRGSLEGAGFVKALGADTPVVHVVVGGRPGFWIEGAPHLISYRDTSGNLREETTRLSANALIWESAGVTHRIETLLGLAETLAIAESVDSVR